MGTGGTCTPHLRKVREIGGGQENLKAHTRTAVLDDSITACNAVCMMQFSFPAVNDSVLHINSFRLCTFCWLCSVVILW